MKKIYTTAALLSVLSSCGVSIAYLGNQYEKTSKVDVFVDGSAIKKPFTIIGKGYEDQRVGYGYAIEKVQEEAIKKAKEKGADAILFQDYYLSQPGYGYTSVTTADSIQRRVITTTSSQSKPIVSSGRTILFLKYD
ncbi:MAG: hypothetical protein V4676_10490 [Bacteroidota bacterium]